MHLLKKVAAVVVELAHARVKITNQAHVAVTAAANKKHKS